MDMTTELNDYLDNLSFANYNQICDLAREIAKDQFPADIALDDDDFFQVWNTAILVYQNRKKTK